MADSDDEYEIPLRDQRYFGAGIKRKRVEFVPSSAPQSAFKSSPATPSRSAADQYLSIVFNKPAAVTETSGLPPASSKEEAYEPDHPPDHAPVRDGRTGDAGNDEATDESSTCDICKRAITSTDSTAIHESSIAHQICLPHSHPPSHIDRTRKGLSVLQSQGWDPDSRKGLGAEGLGILFPVKAKENPRRVGLGVDPKARVALPEKLTKLDAGKVRLRENEVKKKAAKLRDAFYRSDDMEKYLGGEGESHANLDLAAFTRAKRKG